MLTNTHTLSLPLLNKELNLYHFFHDNSFLTLFISPIAKVLLLVDRKVLLRPFHHDDVYKCCILVDVRFSLCLSKHINGKMTIECFPLPHSLDLLFIISQVNFMGHLNCYLLRYLPFEATMSSFSVSLVLAALNILVLQYLFPFVTELKRFTIKLTCICLHVSRGSFVLPHLASMVQPKRAALMHALCRYSLLTPQLSSPLRKNSERLALMAAITISRCSLPLTLPIST